MDRRKDGEHEGKEKKGKRYRKGGREKGMRREREQGKKQNGGMRKADRGKEREEREEDSMNCMRGEEGRSV